MDHRGFFKDLLKSLVAIPSSSQQEEKAAEYLADFLHHQLGMEVQVERIEGKSCNVTAVMNGKGSVKGGTGGGRRILLGGHIDTVAAGEGWETDPYTLTLRGDRAYGLGAADMKGGLAAQITVLKRLVEGGRDFCGTIEFVGLGDEERYSVGANRYVEQRKDRQQQGRLGPAEFALLAEPHFTDIVTGATGKVLLSLGVQGKAGHAAKPETGVNAIDCMTQFLNGVREKYGRLYEEGEAASCCILRIESKYQGYSLSIPEQCSALLNKQLYTQERAEKFIEDLKTLYECQVGRGHLVIKREVPYYPSYQMDQSNADLQMLLELLGTKYGHKPQLLLNQSVSDGNILYSELGIPVVLFGPEGRDYHKPNEFINMNSAYRYMDMLYDYLCRCFGAFQ